MRLLAIDLETTDSLRRAGMEPPPYTAPTGPVPSQGDLFGDVP